MNYLYYESKHNILAFLVGKANKQGVCHTVALPFTLKSILREGELWKVKYFTIIFKKILQNKPNSFKIF